MSRPGRRVASRYELLEPIGSGGMATVWRARDHRLRRTVAVKVLRPQYGDDAGFVLRFISEARNAANLAHPNVVPVFDTGVDQGDWYIVMEHVDGPSLAEVLDERGRLPPDEAAGIAAAVARGLAAAHRRGLVHRDVKPANVLIGRDGRVRVVDFGIARALTTARVTATGMILGSIPYLSPEQALGEEATAATDVYALGVVLFEMLTGRPPWQAPDPAATVYARVHQDPPRPSDVAPELPPGLDAIVGRAMARDPADRYPGGRALADALEAWRRGRASEVVVAAEPIATAAVASDSQPASRPGIPDVGTVVTATARPNLDATVPPAGTPGASDAGVPPHVPTTPLARPTPAPSQPRPTAARRDRRRTVAAILLAGLVGVPLVAATLAPLPEGGVLEETATPRPTNVGGPAVTGLPEPSPVPSLSVTATPSPSPSPSPSATPTATPLATPAPTPRPTIAPTLPPAVASGPEQVVRAFYDAVEAHDFDRAAALWTAEMRERYPPDEYLVGRFTPTTRIDILGVRTLERAGDRARVAVAIREFRDDEAGSRIYEGAWDLVRRDGRWLLADPDLTQTG